MAEIVTGGVGFGALFTIETCGMPRLGQQALFPGAIIVLSPVVALMQRAPLRRLR
jgi:hypothetical protein